MDGGKIISPRRKKRSNEIVVNYHDSLLFRSDVQLLIGNNWLNDNLMAFYFEYLEREKFKNQSNMLFVGPVVTQLIKMSEWEGIGDILEPLNFNEKDFVFFALNDCLSTDVPGGSHWSLLVLSKQENTSYHLDSCSGSNSIHASNFNGLISKYMQRDLECKELLCTQQRNSYDCGIHVLCNVEHLANYIASQNRISGVECVQRSVIEAKRIELQQLIYSMKARSQDTEELNSNQ